MRLINGILTPSIPKEVWNLTLAPNFPLRSKFESRKEFMEYLGDMLTHSYEERQKMALPSEETRGRPPELKTYIMESNNSHPNIEAVTTLEAKQIPTNLSKIDILVLRYKSQFTQFYVDTSDPRFFVLYSNDLAEFTDLQYDRLVSSTANKFDKTWFPTETLDEILHLEGNKFRGFGLAFTDRFSTELQEEQTLQELTMDVAGSISEEALDALNERKNLRRSLSYSKIRAMRGDREAFVTDDIRYDGRLITKSGDSIDDHVSLVEATKKIYRNLVEKVEKNSIGTKKVEDRTLIEGQAFDFVLHREIENLDTFLDYFLNPTREFRLWGLRNKISKNRRQIVAVDLHTGDPFDLEITPSLIRIYLPKGTCGNVVLRIYVNLQHTFDSAIRFNDEKMPSV